MASINEKLNYINETKSLIKDKLNDLGSEIEDETTFRDYAEKIENLYEEWPKTSNEDITISLNNTKKGKMNLQLKGNINQFTTTGKNKLGLINGTYSANGITAIVNNGEIILNGTATANAFVSIPLNDDLDIDLNEVIALSMNNSIANNNIKFRIDSGGYLDTALNNINTTNIINVTYTLINSSITLRVQSGASLTNFKLKPQIELGSSATSYEPYTGGIASPNPNYPQDIEVVTGENTITISNENNTKSQTFNIDLGDLQLYKIGNYQDFLFKQNNKWYKKQKMKEEILTKNNFVEKGTTGTNAYFIGTNITTPNNNDIIQAYSNMFQPISFTNRNNGLDVIYSQNGYIKLRTANNTSIDWSTNDNCKNWLDANTPMICHILAASIDIEITDAALITQLNALEQAISYNEQTNISQTNDNLPFIISASALLKNSD